MTTSSQTDQRVREGAPRAVGLPAGKTAAPRLEASVVPSITGVRISPGDAPARLVNISWSGVLVVCETRLKPGTDVTVLFAGTFQPAQVPSRVARVNVSGIGPTGALTYQIGLAFATPITLPDAPGCRQPRAPAAWPASPSVAATPVAPAEHPPSQSVLRNRW
jgi:hypothetical protein